MADTNDIFIHNYTKQVLITNRCGSKTKKESGQKLPQHASQPRPPSEKDELSWHAFSKRANPPPFRQTSFQDNERKRGYIGEKRGKTSNGYPRTRFISYIQFGEKTCYTSLSLSKTFRVNRIYVCFLDLLISKGCAIILFILLRTND